MKRYYVKIAALALLAIIWQAASASCSKNLYPILLKEDSVPAMDDNMVSQRESCTGESSAKPLPLPKGSLPISGHDSLLPCCTANTPFDTFTAYRPNILEKYFPAIFTDGQRWPIAVAILSLYCPPASPPPELFSIRATVLRI